MPVFLLLLLVTNDFSLVWLQWKSSPHPLCLLCTCTGWLNILLTWTNALCWVDDILGAIPGVPPGTIAIHMWQIMIRTLSENWIVVQGASVLELYQIDPISVQISWNFLPSSKIPEVTSRRNLVEIQRHSDVCGLHKCRVKSHGFCPSVHYFFKIHKFDFGTSTTVQLALMIDHTRSYNWRKLVQIAKKIVSAGIINVWLKVKVFAQVHSFLKFLYLNLVA